MSNSESSPRYLYNIGQYQEALQAYLTLSKQQPHDVDVMLMVGHCYDKLAQKKEAMIWYEKALHKDKNNIIAMSNYATSLYENQDYKKARQIAQKVLKLDSTNIQAYINLGNIEYLEKNFDQALQYYERAYALNPENYITCVNLANTYFDMKNYEQAVNFAKQSIKQDSNQVMSWTILGNAEFELENYTDSVKAFEQALKLDSGDYWLHNYISQAYQKLANWSEAFSEAWQAIELSSDEDSQHINFGYMLYESSLEKEDELIQKYARLWLQKYPDNQIARHMGNSVLNDSIPARANDEYLKNIFDVFAPDFEQVLASLEYRAPQEISEYLQSLFLKQKNPKLKILDAGCGTGLCGNFLKSYSKLFGLYGVDISEKMLSEAKKKKIYHKLYCDELEHFFATQKQQFDMVVSADVFTYFGDLSKVVSGVSKSLTSKGRFIFTVSENYFNDNDYFLHSSGRYLHSQKYIENLLVNNCFSIEKMKKCKLRNEGSNQVFGFLFAAQKTN